MKYGVGIDISKGKSTIAILSVAGEVIEEPFEINHDINGLNLLEEKLKDIPKEELQNCYGRNRNISLTSVRIFTW